MLLCPINTKWGQDQKLCPGDVSEAFFCSILIAFLVVFYAFWKPKINFPSTLEISWSSSLILCFQLRGLVPWRILWIWQPMSSGLESVFEWRNMQGDHWQLWNWCPMWMRSRLVLKDLCSAPSNAMPNLCLMHCLKFVQEYIIIRIFMYVFSLNWVFQYSFYEIIFGSYCTLAAGGFTHWIYGCLQFWDIDLIYSIFIPGFHGSMCDMQLSQSACFNSPCNQGECHLDGFLEDYKCDCNVGFRGEYLEGVYLPPWVVLLLTFGHWLR